MKKLWLAMPREMEEALINAKTSQNPQLLSMARKLKQKCEIKDWEQFSTDTLKHNLSDWLIVSFG